MSSLKASGIIYQARYFEENITTQISGQGQGVFSTATHRTSSIQTSADVVPLDTSTEEILERNKQLLADMCDENAKKKAGEPNYLTSHKDDDIWGIDEYRQVEESANEDDLIFNFDREEDSDSKKFEDFSTLMGKRAGKNAKKDKKTRYEKDTKLKFRKKRKRDFRSRFPKRLRRKTKRSRKEKPSSTKENDLAFKAGIGVLKQDMPMRIILGIIAGIAFIAVVLLQQVW